MYCSGCVHAVCASWCCDGHSAMWTSCGPCNFAVGDVLYTFLSLIPFGPDSICAGHLLLKKRSMERGRKLNSRKGGQKSILIMVTERCATGKMQHFLLSSYSACVSTLIHSQPVPPSGVTILCNRRSMLTSIPVGTWMVTLLITLLLLMMGSRSGHNFPLSADALHVLAADYALLVSPGFMWR